MLEKELWGFKEQLITTAQFIIFTKINVSGFSGNVEEGDVFSLWSKFWLELPMEFG